MTKLHGKLQQQHCRRPTMQSTGGYTPPVLQTLRCCGEMCKSGSSRCEQACNVGTLLSPVVDHGLSCITSMLVQESDHIHTLTLADAERTAALKQLHSKVNSWASMPYAHVFVIAHQCSELNYPALAFVRLLTTAC